MPFPLETINAQEIAGLVNHFVAEIEPQDAPGFTESFDRRIRGFECEVEPLGLKITMLKTEWMPIGKFRSSWLGRATIGKAYPDIYLAINDNLEPNESRIITTRDTKNYAPVFVRQGASAERLQSRQPTYDDLDILNRTLGWIGTL